MKRCKKRFLKKKIFIFIILFIHSFLFSETEDDVIGIVFSIKGTLVLEREGKKENIEPGVMIYKTSLIRLAEATKRGKIQIITSEGPVVYSRFPITFQNTAFAILSDKQQENYIASIGGTVVRDRAGGGGDKFLSDNGFISEEISSGDKIFEWYMDLKVLDSREIKEGFTLVMSKDKSSLENLSLNPLYFKLCDDVEVQHISFEVMEDKTFTTVYESGEPKKKDGDFVYLFDCFKYTCNTPYLVVATITFSDGNTDYWEFSYTIAGMETINRIEEEASRKCSGDESDFEKMLIRAHMYREYDMELTYLRILKDCNLDIEHLMTP
jgi:hypothetical protein